MRILVVEDEMLIRIIVAESLADAGFDVAQAESGEAAIGLLHKFDRLDLLLTDIQMPGTVDGNALAVAAKERFPGLPVIYVTGRPDTLQNGMSKSDAFVRKPFGPKEVLTIINALLAKRQGTPPVSRNVSLAADYK